MWNKSDNISIIDEGLTVDGTVSVKGKLVIKGTVKGSLVGETVIVAEGGVICADTKAASITIGGKFEGELSASNELIILSTGSCSGKVVCKNLVVEAGGTLNGEINCISKQEPTK
jgi:cytoskeletal protein CcmA (bactofilin family)